MIRSADAPRPRLAPNTEAPDPPISDMPLEVAVRGEEVMILSPRGVDAVMTVRAARASAQRLIDAIAVAEGRMPDAHRRFPLTSH